MRENTVNKWWQHTTIYQIYPRSFMDASGSGVGDLRGIISKLDYLEDLGIETIWISPFYESAQQDHGYDISDYFVVDPIFGSNEDADILIKEIHNRGMKVIFDMVMNHTSVEHKWFKESSESIDSPKRDWYIWREGKGKNKPPNNWMSMTGKKGWNYSAKTDQWYYSSFLGFQPDLNYNNPQVVEAMFSVVNYWLEKGVDGFRLDIFNCIGKDQSMKDNPFSWRYFPTPDNNHNSFFQKKRYNFNHPDSFEFAKRLRGVVDTYPDRFLIGEVSGDAHVLKQYIGDKHDGLNTVFLFELIHYKYSKKFFEGFLIKTEKEYPEPYMPTYVLSNHDIGRYISRVNGEMDKAKCVALFQMTNRGVPVIYYGDEIGMENHNLPIKTALDPIAIQFSWVPKWVSKKLHIFLNRDDCRTPMQWTGQKNAGFSTAETTWLPVTMGYKGRNVMHQKFDPHSLLNTYKNLLKLRQENQALKIGKTELLESPAKLLIYSRSTSDEKLIIAINFDSKETYYETKNDEGVVIFSSSDYKKINDKGYCLKPNSGIIIQYKR